MTNEILQRLKQIERWALLSAKNVLTIDDVTALTGLSKSTLYKMTCTHEIAYSKPNGKQIFFARADVEEWMQRNRVNAQQEAESIAAAFCINQASKGGAL